MHNHEVIGSRARASADRMSLLDGQLSADENAGVTIARAALEELQLAVESLQVSAEELRSQNETLLAAREQLERQSARYQHLFDFAPDAYLVTDRNGVILEANHGLFDLLGGDRKMVGRLMFTLVPEKERRALRVRMLRLAHLGQPEQFEMSMLTAAGARVRVAAHGSGVRLAGSEGISELHWALRSLAERERSVAAMNDATRSGGELVELQHMNQQLQTVLANIGDPLFTVDRGWRVLFANQAFERLVDLPARELLGRDFWEVLPDALGSPFHHRMMRAMVTGRRTRLRETYGPARSELDIVAYPTSSGLTVLLMRAGQARKASAAELAAGVAHYFDSYLATIQEAAEQLRLHLDVGDPLRNTASVIAHGTQLCAEVTRRLQAFTRQRVYLPQPTNLNALIRNFRRRIGDTIGADVKLLLHLRPGLPVISADADQLEEALYEVLLNARDAIHTSGAIHITTRSVKRTAPSQRRPSTYVGIDIRDDGSGMSEETRRFAPLPFFTTKDRTVVPGLGLSMAVGIIEQAGGKLRIESRLGFGTTVRIILPAAT
jgi:PAS domain S-box-containing protein